MTDHLDIRASIARMSRVFEDKYNAGNAQGLVDAYFVDDTSAPYASPPGGRAPVSGRSALVEMYLGMMPDIPRIELETIDVVAGGDLAYEVGRAHLTLADGQSVMGRYAICWLHTSDGWRAKIDFFAADGWTN